jgi:hypothetical protein
VANLVREIEQDGEDTTSLPPNPDPAPTRPELLAELAPYDPRTGMPVRPPQEVILLPAAAEAQQAAYEARHSKWAALSARDKTQLAACVLWSKLDAPAFVVQLERIDPKSKLTPDPSWGIVLRAANEREACWRFFDLCGMTKGAGENFECKARPYQPAAEGPP